MGIYRIYLYTSLSGNIRSQGADSGHPLDSVDQGQLSCDIEDDGSVASNEIIIVNDSSIDDDSSIDGDGDGDGDGYESAYEDANEDGSHRRSSTPVVPLSPEATPTETPVKEGAGACAADGESPSAPSCPTDASCSAKPRYAPNDKAPPSTLFLNFLYRNEKETSRKVLPIDLNSLLHLMNSSTFLYKDQTRSIGYDSHLIIPYLDALVEWLAENQWYPVFVMDGLKPSHKEATTKDRKETSNRHLQARLADYLQRWQGGGEGEELTAADHFKGHIHSEECVPFHCSGAQCPTRSMPKHTMDCSVTRGCNELCRVRQLLRRPADPPALYYSEPGPLSRCVDFINVWALAQVHLAAMAREQPLQLAYIGSLSEADEVLSLLSLHFKVPVLSLDLDFAVSGYGQMNIFYLFQKQFQLKKSQEKVTLERNPSVSAGSCNKTLLQNKLKNHLGVKFPNQLAWLPLILGCDFGPPDGRVWDLVKGLFLEDDGQVRLHFEQAARCFPEHFDPWTEESKEFASNWREMMRPYCLSIENLRMILKHLPNPSQLIGFAKGPGGFNTKLDQSVVKVLNQNKSHIKSLSDRLHQCIGPGVLMLLRDSMYSSVNPNVSFGDIRNGILLCLALYNAGVRPMGTRIQKNYMAALKQYLKECPVDKKAPWCILSHQAPPCVTENWASESESQKDKSNKGSAQPHSQNQALLQDQGYGQGGQQLRKSYMRQSAKFTACLEEGPGSEADPGPAPPARCQCIRAPYLVQPLLQGFPHLRLFVQAFYMAFPLKAPKERLAMLPIFRGSLNSLRNKQETSMPPLPQYDILKGGGTVWDWTRQARLLLYFLLSRGPEGVYNGTMLCRMDEHHWPAASMAKACQGNAREVETKSYHLGEHLEGELGAVLKMVDSILKTGRAGGLNRLLLAGVLLSTKWARDVSANFDKKLLWEMLDLCSSDHRSWSRIVQNLELPEPVQSHALAILGESSCLASWKLQEAAGSVIFHCLGVMVHRALGDVEHTRAAGGLPSPTHLTAFSLKLAALCSWLDLYSVLSGRQLSLLMQACASSAGQHAFPHSQSPTRRGGQLPLTQSEVANALLDVLRQTSL